MSVVKLLGCGGRVFSAVNISARFYFYFCLRVCGRTSMDTKYFGIVLCLPLFFGIYLCQINEISDFVTSPRGGPITAGQIITLQWRWVTFPACSPNIVEIQFCPGAQTQGCSRIGTGSFSESSFRWTSTFEAPTGRLRLQLRSLFFAGCRTVADYSPMFSFCRPLLIDQHPQDALAVVGSPTQFWTSASGSQISFQWLFNSEPIIGATQPTHTILSSQEFDNGLYSVRVQDECQTAVTSKAATLRVCPAIMVEQLSPTRPEVGMPFSLTVVATGMDLTFAWSRNERILANSNSLNFSNFEPQDYGAYSVRIEDACGESTELQIMLASRPFSIIENPPSEVLMFVGDSIQLAVVILKGENFSVFYQWFKNGAPIPGETSPTINITNFSLEDDGTKYAVSVGTDGLVLKTEPTVILAHPVPEIVSTSVEPAAVFPGRSVEFSTIAIGQRVQYEWFINGIKQEEMTGLTSIEVQAGSSITSSTEVVVRVSNPNGFVESDPMQIAFNPRPWFIDYERRDIFLLLNQTFSLDLTNQMFGEELTIRWLRNNETIGQRNVTTIDVQLDPSIVSTLYQLEASNPSGVTLGPEIWTHPEPAPEIINYSESPFYYWIDDAPTLYMEAIGEGVQYRWFRGSDLMYFEESPQINLSPLTDEHDGLVVRGEAFNINGFSSSVNITLKMEPGPVITQQPETVQIFLNKTAELSVKAEGRSLKFRWELPLPFTPTHSVDGSTIVVPNVPRSIVATVTVWNPAGEVQSAQGFIVVHPAPVFERIPRAVSPVSVGVPNLFQRSATGVGVTYTWVLNDTVVFDNISDPFWFMPGLTPEYNGTVLRVTASNPSGSATVQTTIIVVTPPELLVPLRSTYDVLIDAKLQINVVAAGYGITFEWRHKGVWLTNNTGQFQIDNTDLRHNGLYHLYMHNLAGTTGPFEFVVLVVPLTVSSPNFPLVYAFAGDPVTLSVNLSSQALSTLSFIWALNGDALPGQISTNLTIANVSDWDQGPYQILISNNRGSIPLVRHITTLKLLGGPVLQNEIFNLPVANVKSGDMVVFSVVATPENRLTYRWYRNDAEIEGETGRSLRFEASLSMNSDRIKVLVSNPVSFVYSKEVTLNVMLSDTTIALSAVFVCLGVAVATVVTAVLVRRKINQRRQITFHKATYGVNEVNSKLLPVWTPPEGSKLCTNIDNLPVSFSKTTLTFGGTSSFDVNEEYTDTIDVSWQGGLRLALAAIRKSNKLVANKASDMNVPLVDRNFTVIFHAPETPKCSLKVQPDAVSLDYNWRPSRPSTYDSSATDDSVMIRLKMNVSTSVTALIGVEMPEINRHFYIPCNITTNPSVWIDIDEIQMDQAPIGEGGFGVVYRGQYKGQDVAVKMLKYQDWIDAKTIEEFEREIQFLSDLNNPGIVSLIGASKLPGKMAIVTQFMPNGSLEKLMAKKIPYGTKLRIALEIAKAIHYLHENNVLHRDIKADNVLIESTDVNSPNMIRLTDFGSARRMEDKLETFTKGVGTPIYMAPEILQRERYNKEADIYSYGVLLWVIITQKEPYTAFKHVWDVSKFVIDGNREAIPAGCPADYAELITDCWHPEPEKRLALQAIIQRLETMYEREFKIES